MQTDQKESKEMDVPKKEMHSWSGDSLDFAHSSLGDLKPTVYLCKLWSFHFSLG